MTPSGKQPLLFAYFSVFSEGFIFQQTACRKFDSTRVLHGLYSPQLVANTHFRIQSHMVAGGRIKPIAVVAGLVIMLLALLYAAFTRSHEVRPQTPPVHQAR